MPTALVLSDLHGRWDKARDVIAKNQGVEYVLVAGDITNFGSELDAAKVLNALRIGPTRPTILAVPGNCDTLAVRKYLVDNEVSIEQRVVVLPIGNVAGIGGGLRRAGVTPYERTEMELRSSAESVLNQIAHTRSKLPTIMVSHTPPYGSNADLRHGQHVGSYELARLMDSFCHHVWVCGHIHESPCVSMEDQTLIVNPGPCANGNYAILTFRTGEDGLVSIHGKLEHLA